MKTPNALKKGDDTAWAVRSVFMDSINDPWTVQVNYKEFQKNVDPALGFIERADFRRMCTRFSTIRGRTIIDGYAT